MFASLLAQLKKALRESSTNLYFFYSHLGYRIFFALALNISVGLLDGFGLAMFLPLMQMVNDNTNVNSEGMGGLDFILSGMHAIGIPLTLLSVLLLMSVFFILKGVALFAQEYYLIVVQQYFIKKVRLENLHFLNNLNFKTFVLSDAGQIQNTLTGEMDRIGKAYVTYFTALQQAAIVAVYVLFAFVVDSQFAVLVTAGGLLSNFLYKKINRDTTQASYRLTLSLNKFQGLIMQYVANYKYLRATSFSTRYFSKLNEGINEMQRASNHIGALTALIRATREPLIIVVVTTVIVIQTEMLGASLAPILISLLFFYRALSNLMFMQSAWNNFLTVSGSMQNMKEFTNSLRGNQSTNGKTEFVAFKNKIELQNASFGYSNNMILRGINIQVNKNETIAFVGESGSGKTTLINILCGLIPLNHGEMYVDGINRNDLKIATYQSRIGYITQDPVIFQDTIFNNITFWDDATPENITRFEKAVQRASLTDFIAGLREGRNSMLGTNGINISGGQKQRVSIARELYKNIDILILDEATSSLDSETEKTIQDNIEELKGQFTMLIVAHRLATVRNADRLVFLREGNVEYIGKFEELFTAAPAFRRMVELQGLN